MKCQPSADCQQKRQQLCRAICKAHSQTWEQGHIGFRVCSAVSTLSCKELDRIDVHLLSCYLHFYAFSVNNPDTGSCRRAPLTQAATSLALLESRPVRDLEKSAWRLLASEVVKMASEAEARQDAPSHILSVWFVVLAWVSDIETSHSIDAFKA